MDLAGAGLAAFGSAAGVEPPPPPRTVSPDLPYLHDFTLNSKGDYVKDNNPPTVDQIRSGEFVRLPLPNGYSFNYPKTVTPEDATNRYQQLTNILDHTYSTMAEAQKSPIITPSSAYSSTSRHDITGPLGGIGAIKAAIDFLGASDTYPGVGNVFHQRVIDPMYKDVVPGSERVTGAPVTWGDVADTMKRVGPYMVAPEAGAYDAVAGIANAVRHGLYPEDSGDLLPTVQKNVVGAEPLPADASWRRIYGEAILSGMSPRNIVGAVLPRGIGDMTNVISGWLPRSAAVPAWEAVKNAIPAIAGVKGSEWGGDVAASLFGENWRELGSNIGGFAGSQVPGVGRITTVKRTADDIAGPQAQKVSDAGQALADDYNRRNPGQPPIENPASIYSMAKPVWQNLFNWLSSAPGGSSITNDRDAHQAAILEAKNATTNALTGGHFIPGSSSKENIGAWATRGAQDAITGINDKINQRYDAIANQLPPEGQEVSAMPILQDIEARLRGQQVTEAQRAELEGLRSNLIASSQYDPRFDPTERPYVPQGMGPQEPYVQEKALKGYGAEARASLPSSPVPVNLSDEASRFAKSSITGARREGVERYGLGSAFDAANQFYADMKKNILPMLYKIGGKPITDNAGNTTWVDQPGYGTAAERALTTKKQSSNEYGVLADHIDPAIQAQMAANAIDQLGTTPEGYFNPKKFNKDWRTYSDGIKATMLSQEPPRPPGVLPATERMDAAATLGQYHEKEPEPSGLGKEVATSSRARDFLTTLSEILPQSGRALGRWGLQALSSGGLTSPAMKRMVAGAPFAPELARNIYDRLATTAVVNQQRNALNRPQAPYDFTSEATLGATPRQ
jgi:hypothetical protein